MALQVDAYDFTLIDGICCMNIQIFILAENLLLI